MVMFVIGWIIFCLFFAEAPAQEAYAFPRLGKMVVPGCQKLSCILIRQNISPWRSICCTNIVAMCVLFLGP